MLAPVEENDFEGCKTRCVCRSHRPFLRAAAADALITLARETETETTSEETTTPAKHRTPEPRRVLRSKDNAANVERGTSSSDKVAAAAVAPPCFEGSFAFAPGSHLSSERDEDGRLLRGGGDSISLGLDLAAAARMGAAANTPPALSRMTREADTPGFGYVADLFKNRVENYVRKLCAATRPKVRSIHWSPYDRVGVVNADP